MSWPAIHREWTAGQLALLSVRTKANALFLNIGFGADSLYHGCRKSCRAVRRSVPRRARG
jgi:hypothetical protein